MPNTPGKTPLSEPDNHPVRITVPPPLPGEASVAMQTDSPPPIIGDEDEDTANEAPLVHRKKREEAEMDMTPMVDVVFLLLIFFMITASFGLQKSIEIPAPDQEQSSNQAPTPQQPDAVDQDIVVRVTKENRIFVDDEEAPTRQELLAKLRDRIHAGRRAGRLLLIAESDASHEYVVRALDAGNVAGVESIRIQTVP